MENDTKQQQHKGKGFMVGGGWTVEDDKVLTSKTHGPNLACSLILQV